ncbi:MAG TPA: ABC transporter ATP-binding protein [Pseudonocardiaceae bacterium]
MSDLAVRVRGLVKRYSEQVAVDGLDLDIHRGEVYALLGPNGAGKTTSVEIMEGFRRRSAGEVTVLGEDPQRAGRAWRARLGIVSQSATDLGELTVREAVRHYAGYFPAPRDPDEVVEVVGLTEHARKRIGKLSGGQRRRVDVALGIVGRPELLFLDEPTTGFDPAARRQFWTLVADLSGAGTTILLTTHYLDEAEALADRVGVIARGRLVTEGDPATLGGRSSAKAVVSWQEDGRRMTEETDTPDTVVAGLMRRHDGAVPGLTITRPSLEDAYLSLIGAASADDLTGGTGPADGATGAGDDEVAAAAGKGSR